MYLLRLYFKFILIIFNTNYTNLKFIYEKMFENGGLRRAVEFYKSSSQIRNVRNFHLYMKTSNI